MIGGIDYLSYGWDDSCLTSATSITIGPRSSASPLRVDKVGSRYAWRGSGITGMALEEQVRDLSGGSKLASRTRPRRGSWPVPPTVMSAQSRPSYATSGKGPMPASTHYGKTSSTCVIMSTRALHKSTGFTEVRGKLDGTAAGQRRIAELIQTLINQQEQ